MKPGDHPDFFRLPPPPGHSRESSIRLDAEGRFWHEGAIVAHAGMAAAFATWITRHPDDGRYILSNGYDWSYFEVADVPFFVRAVRLHGAQPMLLLSDGTEEPLDPSAMWVGARDALYSRVKGGRFDARFMPAAQTALLPLLVEGEGGEPALQIGDFRHRIADRAPARAS
jgi:hypothetical protein